jgi:phage tail protein X
MLYEGSRYLSTVPYLNGEGEVLLSRRRRKKFNSSLCNVYVWIQGDTLDTLSYKIYGSSSLWWAILDANPKYSTEMDIHAGDYLLIPNYNEVVVSEIG